MKCSIWCGSLENCLIQPNKSAKINFNPLSPLNTFIHFNYYIIREKTLESDQSVSSFRVKISTTKVLSLGILTFATP